MTITPLSKGAGSLYIIPNQFPDCVPSHKIQLFFQLRYWSLDTCKALINWHLIHERHYRQGWNNNLSLTNYDIEPNTSEVTWSVILYKLDYFKNSFAIAMPFKFLADDRGVPRAYTKFRTIKKQAVVWSIEEGCYLEGSGRNSLIEMLLKRIVSGMGWDESNCRENVIRRYRLLQILNNPKLYLCGGLDVHHKDGIAKILSGNTLNIDDRMVNLDVVDRPTHSSLHASKLDTGWVDM